MKRSKVTQVDMRRFLQDYRDGKLPRELVRELEEQSGQSIDELVARIESAFTRKSHRIDGMTLPELRRWYKKKDVLSDEESWPMRMPMGARMRNMSVWHWRNWRYVRNPIMLEKARTDSGYAEK